MALTQSEKQALVAEVADVAANSVSMVAAEYRGLSVTEMTELRAKARAADVYLRVVRNTLSRRAIEGTEFECMQESLNGPLFLAFSREAPNAAARLLRDFAKEHKSLKVTALSINGELLSAEQLNLVANLPTKEEAVAQLLYIVQAPMTQLVRTLAEPTAQLARALAAIRDQKEAA